MLHTNLSAELPQQSSGSCVMLWLTFKKILLTNRNFKNRVTHLSGFRNLNSHLQTWLRLSDQKCWSALGCRSATTGTQKPPSSPQNLTWAATKTKYVLEIHCTSQKTWQAFTLIWLCGLWEPTRTQTPGRNSSYLLPVEIRLIPDPQWSASCFPGGWPVLTPKQRQLSIIAPNSKISIKP